jgi:PAS domain S-box-containing protein
MSKFPGAPPIEQPLTVTGTHCGTFCTGASPRDGSAPAAAAADADLKLAEIIDIEAVDSMLGDFFLLTRIPIAILDLQGNVLVGKGWQRICTLFHRVHPEARLNCLESDLTLTDGIVPGEFRLYKCKNNMWDVATPITAGGAHLGNLFSGQFFFDDEPPDEALFRAQAKRYGFQEQEYLEALQAVPRIGREFLNACMRYLVKITDLISKLSYSNLQLARTLRERNALMQTLHESEERFRVLSENSPDLIALHDRELRHLYVNPALCNFMNAPQEYFLGKTVAEIGTSAAGAANLDRLLRQVLDTGEAYDGELSMPAADGTAHFAWRSVPVLDAAGEVRAVLAIATNMTERKRAEEELRRAHDELEKRVAERTQALTATVKTLRREIAERQRVETSLLRLNRLYAVLGETDQAIIRAKDRDSVFHDFCRIAVEQGGFLLAWVGVLDARGRVQKAAAWGATAYLDELGLDWDNQPFLNGPSGHAIRSGTYHICNDFQKDEITAPWHETGQRFGVHGLASVALKEAGEVVGMLALYAPDRNFFDQKHLKLILQMGTDISFALDNLAKEALRERMAQALHQETLERLQAVEELREKDRLLQQQTRLAAMGEMINNIAHQWRQPLNVLGLLVQQLQLSYEMGAFDQELLDGTVGKSMGLINHMSQTIEDFRNFFKPDKEKAEFAIHEVAAKAVALVEDSFANQQISVVCLVKDQPVAFGFANEYSQVLLNILLNARDALLERKPERAKVTVTISREGGKGVVTIADNAGGIPEEIIGKVFEPYFTTKGPGKGTGVGLYMSKTIIEKNMHGSLTVCNTADGAEFRIEL